MSLLVVGLNHRTVPVELLERLAVAPEATAEGAARPDARASTSPRSCCSPRATAPRSTRTPRCSTPRCRTSATSSPTPSGVDPDEFSDLLYTYHDDAAVAHLFGVAAGPRLDDHRRGRDPRPGARGVADRRARVGQRPVARPHVPPRDRGGQAGPHRDRHRPSRGVGVVGGGVARRPIASARSTTGGCSCSVPATWARAWCSRSRARAWARSWSRTAPDAARRGARRARRRPGRRLRRRRRRARRRATCCSCPPAQPTCSSSARDIEAGDDDARRARAAHRRHRRAARRRPGCGRGVRRHAARHRRPARVRRAVARAAPPGDRQGARPPRPTSSTGTASSAAPARSRRSSPRCGRAPRTCRVGELERAAARLDGPRPPSSATRSRRSPSALVQQAAPRADRAAEGRGGQRPRRALRRRARRAVRPPGARRRPPRDDPRGSRRGAPSSRGGRRSASPRCSAADAELVIVTTTGDARPDTPIARDGRHRRVREGGASRRCSTAVPTSRCTRPRTSRRIPPPDGLVLAAFPERGDPRDALVGARSPACRPGAVVGTGSVRRRAQLAAVHAALEFAELRGNITTRLEKAVAVRRDRGGRRRARPARACSTGPTRCSSPTVMLPQVGQGALAVECRADDDAHRGAPGGHRRRGRARARSPPSARSSPASAVGATCPCGALATVDDDASSCSQGRARLARRPHACCATSRRAPIPEASGVAARSPSCSTTAARELLERGRAGDRLPGRRRAR